MPSIYQLKPAFQNLLRPLVRGLAAIGVRANHVTVFAILLSLAVGVCIALYPAQIWPFGLVPVVLFVRMALNAIDGMLAREFNQKSNLGAILNELGDVFSDTFLYLPYMLHADVAVYPVIAFCLLAIISEMTGVIGVQIGASRRYDGPMGKSDRAFVMGALAIVLCLQLAIVQPLYIEIALWVISFLILVTIFNRGRQALREVQS